MREFRIKVNNEKTYVVKANDYNQAVKTLHSKLRDFDDTKKNINVVREFITNNGGKFSESKDADAILDFIYKKTGVKNADYGDVLYIVRNYTNVKVEDNTVTDFDLTNFLALKRSLELRIGEEIDFDKLEEYVNKLPKDKNGKKNVDVKEVIKRCIKAKDNAVSDSISRYTGEDAIRTNGFVKIKEDGDWTSYKYNGSDFDGAVFKIHQYNPSLIAFVSNGNRTITVRNKYLNDADNTAQGEIEVLKSFGFDYKDGKWVKESNNNDIIVQPDYHYVSVIGPGDTEKHCKKYQYQSAGMLKKIIASNIKDSSITDTDMKTAEDIIKKYGGNPVGNVIGLQKTRFVGQDEIKNQHDFATDLDKAGYKFYLINGRYRISPKDSSIKDDLTMVEKYKKSIIYIDDNGYYYHTPIGGRGAKAQKDNTKDINIVKKRIDNDYSFLYDSSIKDVDWDFANKLKQHSQEEIRNALKYSAPTVYKQYRNGETIQFAGLAGQLTGPEKTKVLKRLGDSYMKDADPVKVEKIIRKEKSALGITYYLFQTKSSSGATIYYEVTDKSYHGEPTYSGGGIISFSLQSANDSLDSHLLYDKLVSKYGKVAGRKRFFLGKNDSVQRENDASTGYKYRITNNGSKWYYETTFPDGHTTLTGPYSSKQETEQYFHKHRPTEKLTDANRYNKGQKFQTSAGIHEIIGYDPVKADANTNRIEYSYRIKTPNGTYTNMPDWQLEELVKLGRYKLIDSNISDTKFLVHAYNDGKLLEEKLVNTKGEAEQLAKEFTKKYGEDTTSIKLVYSNITDADPVKVEKIIRKEKSALGITYYIFQTKSSSGYTIYYQVTDKTYHGEPTYSGGGIISLSLKSANDTLDHNLLSDKLKAKYGEKEGTKRYLRGENDSAIKDKLSTSDANSLVEAYIDKYKYTHSNLPYVNKPKIKIFNSPEEFRDKFLSSYRGYSIYAGGLLNYNGYVVKLFTSAKDGKIESPSADNIFTIFPTTAIKDSNNIKNRISYDDLKRTINRVMEEGNDKDIVNILIGQLAELKKDYEKDINNSKLDKEETKQHYNEYKRLVNNYKNSHISKEYTNAVNSFLSAIKDSDNIKNRKSYTIKVGDKQYKIFAESEEEAVDKYIKSKKQ